MNELEGTLSMLSIRREICRAKEKKQLIGWRTNMDDINTNHIRFLLVRAKKKKIAKVEKRSLAGFPRWRVWRGQAQKRMRFGW